MNWADTIVHCLKDAEISLIAYVPDKSISKATQIMEEEPFFHVVSATREEEAIGIAAGRTRRAETPPCSCSPAGSATASMP